LSNIPQEEFDSALTTILGELARHFSCDRCTLAMFRGHDTHFSVTHSWAAPDLPQTNTGSAIEPKLPWYTQQIRSGHVVQLTNASDLPAAAVQERTFLLDNGIKSLVSIPLITEETVIGSISFGILRQERHWPQEVVTRLRLVAEVLALGIRHRQYGDALDSFTRTMQEVSLQKPRAMESRRSEQLRRLAVRLIMTEQQERRRIGEVLHEDIMQMLASIAMLMGSIENLNVDKQSSVVGQSAQLLREAVQKLRRLATELRPEGLSRFGIAEGIRWLTDQVRLLHDELEVEVVMGDQLEPVREDVRLFLYDAARKLLDNVVTHSGGRKARLELRRVSARDLQLTVSDEGAGFDVTGLKDIPSNSFGLFSIREEAELLGGRLDIRSAPGKGTRISLIVPS
jgi:signal transduction histidine kinase